MSVNEETQRVINQIVLEKLQVMKKKIEGKAIEQVQKKEERSQIAKRNEQKNVVIFKMITVAVIATVVVLLLSTAYFIYLSLGQQQQLEQQSKKIQQLANKLTSIEDRLATVQNNYTLCTNNNSILKAEISELQKSLKQMKEFDQVLNIKMGYINEELSQIRTTTAQFSQAFRHPGHQHQNAEQVGRPNRRHV